jgi:hypothetical protein
MRAKFAIASEPSTIRRPGPPRKDRPRSNNNTASISSDDGADPDYSARVAATTTKRPLPSSLVGYAHNRALHVSPRTTLTSRMLFKQQQDFPITPQTNQLTAVGAGALSAPSGAVAISGLPIASGAGQRGGRLASLVAEEARGMSMRKLSNYANQRVQQQEKRRQRGAGGGFEEEEEEEEEDNDNGFTVALVQAPPLFSPENAYTWMARTATTPTVATVNATLDNSGEFNNKSTTLSFAGALAGLPISPAAPTVLPSRFIGTAFSTGNNGLYNAVNYQTGAAAAYALQESFHLPSLLETAAVGGGSSGVGGNAASGGDAGDGSGGSSGSGHHDLDPTADDLLAGIQMFSGQDASPTEYKDWLCNSPQDGIAPSPRT